MADYNKISQFSLDSSHQGRVRVALHAAARNIVLEDPTTLNHERRIEWALNFRADANFGIPLAQVCLLVIADTPSFINQVNNDMTVTDEDAYASALQPIVNNIVDDQLALTFV